MYLKETKVSDEIIIIKTIHTLKNIKIISFVVLVTKLFLLTIDLVKIL